MEKTKFTPTYLIQIANHVYNCDCEIKSNVTKFVYARMAVSYHLREQKMKLSDIGAVFNKDHCAVVHYLKRHNDLLNFDKIYAKLFNQFTLEINRPISQENHKKTHSRLRINQLITELRELGYSFEQIEEFWKECITIAKKPCQNILK